MKQGTHEDELSFSICMRTRRDATGNNGPYTSLSINSTDKRTSNTSDDLFGSCWEVRWSRLGRSGALFIQIYYVDVRFSTLTNTCSIMIYPERVSERRGFMLVSQGVIFLIYSIPFRLKCFIYAQFNEQVLVGLNYVINYLKDCESSTDSIREKISQTEEVFPLCVMKYMQTLQFEVK